MCWLGTCGQVACRCDREPTWPPVTGWARWATRATPASRTCATLALVWLTMWAAYAFAGRATPIEPEAFKLVAALDLSMMVTALVLGGVSLWRRSRWGYVIAAIAGIQSALYLTVLSVNAWVAIARGLARAPGELPVWGTLALLTTAAMCVLLSHGFAANSSTATRSARASHGPDDA